MHTSGIRNQPRFLPWGALPEGVGGRVDEGSPTESHSLGAPGQRHTSSKAGSMHGVSWPRGQTAPGRPCSALPAVDLGVYPNFPQLQVCHL